MKQYNNYFLYVGIVMLLFPTLSIYNIGALPILRVDFVGQIILIIYFFINRGVCYKKREILLVTLFILLYGILNVFNYYILDDFNPFQYIKMLVQVITLSVIILVISISCRSINIDRLFGFIIKLGVVISLYAVYQILAHNFIDLPYSSLVFNSPRFQGVSVVSEFYGFNRPTSVFYEPSHLAFFLQAVIIIQLFTYDRAESKPILKIILLIFNTLVFISTISIFNFFSLALVLIIMIKQIRLLAPIAVFAAMYLAEYYDISGPLKRVYDIIDIIFIQQDVLSSTDGSLIRRLGKLTVGFEAWLNNIFIGTGLNNLILGTSGVKTGEWHIYTGDVSYVNIYLLQSLAETGIVGFSSLLLLLVYYWNKITNIKRVEGCDSKINISLALFYALLLGQDLPLTSPMRIIYFIVILTIIRHYEILHLKKRV